MAPCQSHSSSHSNLFFDGCGRFFTHSECGVVPAGPFRTDFPLVYICSGLQMHCLHNWLLSLGNNKLFCCCLTFRIFSQFVIEAVVGGEQGYIAMDDIVVSGSVDSSCPPERECSFHGSLCGLLPQPSADFHWNRITGASQPGNSSADSNVRAFSPLRGAMMTAVMEPTPPDGECLTFWYYMEGADVGELSVLLQPDASHTTTLWWLSGNHGDVWQHEEVLVGRVPTDFTLLFEASRDFNQLGHVSIDDVSFSSCALPAADKATGDLRVWLLPLGRHVYLLFCCVFTL
uniref:MAM domain-containing protein n=1 Tax=Oryzias latipes TaxID=8090 RepID=A0A3B3I5C0_ORYLA